MEVCFCSCVERTKGNKTCNLSSFVVMKFVVTGVTTMWPLLLLLHLIYLNNRNISLGQ